MRRLLLSACLVAALVVTGLPASAAATVNTFTRAFSGTLQSPVRADYRQGRINFKAKVKVIDPRDGPKRFLVTAILPNTLIIRNILFDCDQGLGLSKRGSGNPRIRVADNRFVANIDYGPRDARLTGRFFDRASEASGTLRVRGDFPENGVTGCDTGLVRWTAD
jgi:hypothetical protein